MPLQSKRISLSALGIQSVPGMVYGNHLRIGFDPRMGFPSCGFEILRRPHLKGPTHKLDIDRLLTERRPALFRWGYAQNDVRVFHPLAPRPTQSAGGGIEITTQTLGLSFRPTPFTTDSTPKVCEVRMRIRSSGTFVVSAFDDRYNGKTFEKILVDQAQRRGLPLGDLVWLDRLVLFVYRAWTRSIRLLIQGVLGNRLSKAETIEEADDTSSSRANLSSILASRSGLSDDSAIHELGTRFFPEIVDTDRSDDVDSARNVKMPTRDIAGWRRFVARAMIRLNRFASNTVFRRWRRVWGSVHDITLRADLISLVEIEAPASSRLESFEYVEVSDNGWTGIVMPTEAPWGLTKEIPLLLPTADELTGNRSTYPTCDELQFSGNPDHVHTNLPRHRLESGFMASTGANDIHGEYPDLETLQTVYLGPEPNRERFEQLVTALRLLQQQPPSQQLDVEMSEAGDASDESSSFSPLFLVLAGSVDPHFARMVGLGLIDSHVKESDHFDYKVIAKWNGIEYSWITHGVFPGRDGLLAPPAVATAASVVDATRPGDVKTNVILEWESPGPIERLRRENQHIGYHVFRRRVDTPGPRKRLTDSVDELSGFITPNLQLLAEVQGDGPQAPNPGDSGHFLDRPPEYGVYDYGIQAEDLFGRRSKIVWTEAVKVPVLIDPSPVSDLYACYLDSDDPEQADLLDQVALRILASTGQLNFSGRALLIEWRYPKASIDAIAGDVDRFELSYRHGRPNEIVGMIGEATIVGAIPAGPTAPVEADVDMTSVVPIDPAIADYGGEVSRGTLVSTGEHFRVESATRLDAHRLRLRVHARRDYLPRQGSATLGLGAGGGGIAPHSLYISPRDPASWSGFDLRQPPGSTDQGVVRFAGGNNNTLTPLPVGIAAGDVVVSRTIEPPSNLDSAEPATPQDWVYRVVVKDVDIPLPAGQNEYSGAVTVQVVSGAGRRSELPAPAFATRRHHEPPLPISELASADFELATRPDFEGRIGARLTWPKRVGIQQYNIYRVEVQRLLQEVGAADELALNLTESESNRAAIKLIGGQLASVKAFTLTTPVPITPATDPQALNRHRWVDWFPAPRDSAYLYRVQPIDAFGQVADWPADAANNNENRDRCILVLQRNRDAILTPSIYEIEPLDRGLHIVVRKPTTETITGMRVYKTDHPESVQDIRKMTIIHGTIPFTHPRISEIPAVNGTPARLKFTDEKIRVGVQYFYRIVFVDEFGNVSVPSEPMAATPRSLAPPEPPTLTAARTAMATIQLSWIAGHEEGEVRVQRKRSGESTWLDVVDAWHEPSDNVIDADATGIVAHRLLLRDPKGRFVYSEPVITEA